jgi:hypothetical protein
MERLTILFVGGLILLGLFMNLLGILICSLWVKDKYEGLVLTVYFCSLLVALVILIAVVAFC